MDTSRCFEIHHVSSFEMYVCANKSKLKTCYPFLSSHQINNKLKDAWKSLNEQQKKKYCKATVKVTPEKRVRKQRQKREKLMKKKSAGREKKEELTRVSDTPEYVNTMKLHDFREKHLVKYKNDFGKDWPVFQSDLQRLDISYKTNQMSEHIPDVDETSTKQHQILKLSSGKKKTEQISFATKANIYNSDSDDDGGVLITRNEAEQFSDEQSTIDDSQDTDAVLLHRYCPSNVEKLEPTDTVTQLDTGLRMDTESDCGETVKVETDQREIKQDQGSIDGRCQEVHHVGSMEDNKVQSDHGKRNDVKINGEMQSEVGEEIIEVYPFQRKRKSSRLVLEEEAKDEEVEFKSPEPKKRKGKKQSQGNNCKARSATKSRVLTQTTPVLQVTHMDLENYTTPQMDEGLQKLTMVKVNKAPQKRRQSHDVATKEEKLQALSACRRVTRSLLNDQSSDRQEVESKPEGMLETEENDLQTNRTPKKDAEINCDEDTESEGLCSLQNIETKVTSCRTRKLDDGAEMKSLKQRNICTRRTKTVPKLNPWGDAGQEKAFIDGNGDRNNNSLKTHCYETGYENSSNFKGNNMKNPEENKPVAMQKGDNMVDQSNGQSYAGPRGCNLSNKSGDKGRGNNQNNASSPDKTEYVSSSQSSSLEDIQSLDIVLSSSSDISSTSGILPKIAPTLRSLKKPRKDVDAMNPVLENVLEGLRKTAVGANRSWHNSEESSPRLLSPALSGISELSSVSSHSVSSSSNAEENQATHNIQQPDVQFQKTGGELCDMFKDITPPEQKTTGQYKTMRMLSSGKMENDGEFLQVFHNDVTDENIFD